MTADSVAQQKSTPDPHRWRAFGVSLIAGFMGLLDVSIVNVALPSMTRGLDASPSAVQWVVSGYALTFGLALVAGGRLGDALGRRRMFFVALIGFVLSSAAAGAAPDEALLIAARLVQGLAAGMLTPQNSGLIQDLFAGAERGRAFGVFGAVVGISTATGPILGGVILAAFGEQQGWRWVFLVNVPIGAVALVLAARYLPAIATRRRSLRHEIDVVGALLLGLTVLCVLLPVLRSEGGGSGALWALLPGALVFGAAFLAWERRMLRRGRPPLLDLKLFTSTPGYASGAGLGAVYFCGFSGVFLVLAVFFQNGLGYTPLQSGLAVTPFALGSAVSAVLAGRLVPRLGRWLTIGGLCLVILGLSVAALLIQGSGEAAALWSALPLLVAGFGGGAVISPNTTLTLEHVPGDLAGVAGGALQTGQRIGTAIGTAVLATVFYALVPHGYGTAISVALFSAAGFVVVALVIAVLEFRARQHRPESPAEPGRTHAASATDTHHH